MLEDEGTPPAEHEGFLSGNVSPIYEYARPNQVWGNTDMRSRGHVKERVFKQGASAIESGSTAVDLVLLLEENWFWRSNTASPSMIAHSSSSRLDNARQSESRPRRRSGYMSRPSQLHEAELRAPPNTHEEAVWEDSAAREQDGNACEPEVFKDGSDATTVAGSPRLRRRSLSANDMAARGNAADSSPDIAGDPKPNFDALDTIGTWGHRVIRFGADKKASLPTLIPGTPEEPELRPRSARSRKKQNGKGDQLERLTSNDEETAAVNAAWRWRFNRRWRTEQAKQLDPDFGLDDEDEDGWDDALGYLDACGPGIQHQIARTTSLENNLGASSLKSNGSETVQFSVDDSQKDKGGLGVQADMDATKKVRSVAKKAQDLYRQQQKIEKDVKARWGSTQFSMSWAGQHLKTVIIDPYGAFLFVLVKVSDRTNAHRLLIRGKNGLSKDDLMRDLLTEVNTVCKDRSMPVISVALIGSGMISWSRERDRRINVYSGRVEKGGDPSIQGSDDVCRLAGALTRASMPAPNHVTVNGKKLS